MRTERHTDTGDRAKITSGQDDAAPEVEATDRGPARDLARISRRTFVLTTGAFGTGLVGSARGSKQGVGGAVIVEATEPYRPAVTDAAGSFERENDGVDVRVRSPRSEPARRLRDGDVDVHVSGRPMLAGGDAPHSGIGRRATASGWAGLIHSEAEWRDCLRQRELRERWRGDDVVETWSETDWKSVSAVGRSVGSFSDRDSDGSGSERRGSRGTSGLTALVRGRRSYQYAQGFGGVGYYRVGEDAIDVDPDVRAAYVGSNTPLVRIGYVHVDGAVTDANVEAFLECYGRYTRTDEVASFTGPHMGDGSLPGRPREPELV